jgi:hypothetical protein
VGRVLPGCTVLSRKYRKEIEEMLDACSSRLNMDLFMSRFRLVFQTRNQNRPSLDRTEFDKIVLHGLPLNPQSTRSGQQKQVEVNYSNSSHESKDSSDSLLCVYRILGREGSWLVGGLRRGMFMEKLFG